MQLPTQNELLSLITNFQPTGPIENIIYAAIYFISGFIIASITAAIVAKITAKHTSAHHSMLFRRIIYYLIVILFIMLALKTLGVEVGTLLGAAGIGAVAISFASQTGMSNIISGIFLIIEKPFVVGDLIVLNETTGEVLSIDLLSINIRTRDNTLVRIPNELLLKSQVQNLSRFPIRRLDLKFRFSFDENMEKIKTILFEVAQLNYLCLASPAPKLHFLEFSEAGLLIQFSVWSTQAAYDDLKTNIQIEIQKAFNAQQVQIPFYYQTISSQILENTSK